MAEVVKLITVDWDALGATVSTLQMLDGTDGVYVERDGWVQQVAVRNRNGLWPNVIETISVQIAGSSADDLADKENALQAMIRNAQRDTLQPQSNLKRVYLVSQLNNETEARYARVRWIDIQQSAALHQSPVSSESFVSGYTLVIERSPFWEPTPLNYHSVTFSGTQGFLQTASSSSGASVLNGELTLESAEIAPRIGTTSIQALSGGPFDEIWLGFRTDEAGGDASEYRVSWDCTNASSTGDDTTLTDPYAAIDFGTTTSMAHRFTILTQDIYTDGTGDPQYARGEFIVLARASVSGTDTYRMRMLDGYSSSGIWTYHSPVSVPASGVSTLSYFLYNLGTVEIPPGGDPRALYIPVRSYGIRIEAELASGSGGTDELRIDRLYLIPIGEGGMYITGDASSDDIYWVYSDEFDKTMTLLVDTSQNMREQPEFHPADKVGWSIPAVDSKIRMYCVAQRATVHNTSDQISVTVAYKPRWAMLRGDAVSVL